MIEIPLSRATEFDLELTITGVDQAKAAPEVRFSILSEGLRFSVPAKHVDGKIYRFSIPALEDIVPAGQHDMEVEVVMEDRHFVPIADQVFLREDLKVGAATLKEIAASGPAITAKIGRVREEKPKTTKVAKKAVAEKAQPRYTVTRGQVVTRPS